MVISTQWLQHGLMSLTEQKESSYETRCQRDINIKPQNSVLNAGTPGVFLI